METQVQIAQLRAKNKNVTNVQMGVQDYLEMPVPGFRGASFGACFVRVLDVPGILDQFMAVNPRMPKRAFGGSLVGPVVKDILETLQDRPEEMVLKNRGLFILAENVQFKGGHLSFALSDVGKHGLVDGGHSFCCIREAVENPEDYRQLEKAYVRLHIVQGLKADQVLEIASGLNTSKAVDDTSLMNLNGDFDVVRRSLRGTKAESIIAYSQGESKPVYVPEILGFLAALDIRRFHGQSQPAGLYNKKSLAVKYYAEDLHVDPVWLESRVGLLPQILELVDSIRIALPDALKKSGWKVGMAKIGTERVGSKQQRGKALPFTGLTSNYKVPMGWVMPILAAFRANLKETKNGLSWKMNPEALLKDTIENMAGLILAEHKASGGNPNIVGKQPSVYRAAHDVIQLYLAKRRLL